MRIDSHVYTGFEITPHYDSMIAKIIARGDDRADAIRVMSRALRECAIQGVQTTLPVGAALMSDSAFKRGEYTTAFLDHFMEKRFMISPRDGGDA